MNELMSGFIGAIIGGLIGFGGVIWQFRAQLLASERELAASLLVASEKIREGYRERSLDKETLKNPDRIEPLLHYEDDLLLTLRRWEVGGNRKTYPFAHRHGLAAVDYMQGFRQEVQYGSLPGTGVDYGYETAWDTTRQELIAVSSRATGSTPGQVWKRRQLRMKYLKPERKLQQDIDKASKKLRRSRGER